MYIIKIEITLMDIKYTTLPLLFTPNSNAYTRETWSLIKGDERKFDPKILQNIYMGYASTKKQKPTRDDETMSYGNRITDQIF